MTDLVVETTALAKRFGATTAVDGLDLAVERGEVHGFLGPNGAGKSTTVRLLLGFLTATGGRIRVHGRDPATSAADINRATSYVPGDVALWGNLTGREVLDALAGLRGGHDRAAERELIDAFALDPGRRIRTYSKGNRQKVMLVAAFAARTELLVLDEPTSGLDPLMEQVFQRQVRRAAAAGRTVLLSSHILAEVERLSDSVTIIRDGRLVETGRLADLRHLAASTVTASIDPQRVAALRAHLDLLGGPALAASLADDGTLRAQVGGADVARVVAAVAEQAPRGLACTPATLEDLFLRHYETAAA